MVFQAYGRAVTEHTARLQRLGQELNAQVKAWRLHPVVDALQAFDSESYINAARVSGVVSTASAAGAG